MELTEKQRKVVAEVERDLRASLDSFLAMTPEENLAQGIESMRQHCEELNARTFDEQLRTFAFMQGVYESDVEKWKEQVESIHWRVEVLEQPSDAVANVIVDVKLRRAIEQVFFTVTVE